MENRGLRKGFFFLAAVCLMLQQGSLGMAQDKVLEKIVTDWQRRREKINSLKCEMKGETVFPKGRLSRFPIIQQDFGKETIPSMDRQFPLQESFTLDFKTNHF